MLRLGLRHLALGKIKHLLAQQLENLHVVLAQRLGRAARPHNVGNEGGPLAGPLLLENLHEHAVELGHQLALHLGGGGGGGWAGGQKQQEKQANV